MKITGVTIKQTKKGDDYKLFTLEGGKKLSVFQWDTRYPDLTVGIDLSDDLLEYDKEYDNYKLRPLMKPTIAVKSPGGYKPIAQAMETKKENIKEAQEHKQEGIKQSAIIRDATLTTIAEFGGQGYTYDDFTATWDRYAKFFQNKWEQAFY